MIIVAIDETNFQKASKIIDELDPKKCMIKIGSVSFNSMGEEIITYVSKKNFEIFLDLKLHDIPNTVKKSIQSLIKYPIKMLTIHISGGREMMQAAMEAVSGTDIKVFGVTALTSLNSNESKEIYQRNTSDQVTAMLSLAESIGIHGIVCSPHELRLANQKKSLLTVTPGIRIKSLNDDQKRVMTPQDAIKLGADYIVIGRPITSSDDIKESLNKIYESIS
tara:strand:- start:1098 stop:1760 length:663 start_codon:yes stop_codon:yes gene_type:complete